jgi:predicted kinase
MEKTKLILTRGIQGSGKTTWARQWVAEDPDSRVRINNDDLRNMLGNYWVVGREPLVSEMKQYVTQAAMDRGYNIVIDNMNLNPHEVKFWEKVVELNNEDPDGYKYEIEFKDFFIPLEECIRRDAMRPNPIGEKVIRETWKRYKHFIQTSEVEKYVNNLIKEDESKPYCLVVDMDSTLCFNTTKRPWYGEGAAEGMINDVPNMGVLRLVQQWTKSGPAAYTNNLIIATGRDTSQEEVTKQWLAKYNIYPQEFYFRREGDYRKGVEVKKEQIEKILEKYNVVAIIDDCEPIVNMYREMGLTVLQPNKGL